MSQNLYFRLAVITLSFGLLLAAAASFSGAAASPTAPGVGGPAPHSQDPGPAELPCDPVASRVVEPRVVGPRGTVDVRVEFNYHCPETNRAIQYFLVVENSRNTRPPGWGGGAFVANVREGLTKFVDQIDYEQGSEGGLILYNSNFRVDMPLEGGSGGQRKLKNAVDNFTTTDNDQARAVGQAVERATELLSAAEAPTGTLKLILIFDAGASIANPIVDPLEACQAAKDAGIHMAVYALDDAGDRVKDCADEASFRGGNGRNGDDIPDKMEAFGRGFTLGQQAERLGLMDALSEAFEFVAGSGSPTEPVSFLNEINWDILPPPPPEGHVYTYEARVRESIYGQISPLSRHALLTIFYHDGTFGEVALDNPAICVHPPGNEAFCDSFVATLTPPAPTDTPTATPTATEAVDTPTPTPTEPTPTPTEEIPEAYYVYLPSGLNAATFPGG